MNHIAAVKPTVLKSPLNAADTTIKLREFVDRKGVALTLADFGSWFVVVVKQGDTWEQIKCDGLTQNADGSATATIASSGRNISPKYPYAGSASGEDFQTSAEVVVTNDMLTMQLYPMQSEENTWTEEQTFSVPPKILQDPVATADAVRKSYVDALVLGTLSTINVIVPGKAGESIAAGNSIYFDDTTNRWLKTDADNAATVQNVILGIAQGTGTAGNAITGGVLLQGEDTHQSAIVEGDVYYVGNTAGAISNVVGTTEVTIGIGGSAANKLYFNPRFNQQLTEDQQDALTGTVGSPSNSNKFVTELNTTSASVDQSQTTQNATVELGEANATLKKKYIAQSFIPTKTKIRGVRLYKAANTGSFTGTVQVAIQADSSGTPSGVDLATLLLSNGAWLALSTGEFEAIFSTEYQNLTIGGLYWIVISTSTADNANHPNLGTNSAGGYASGLLRYNNVTDGWQTLAADLYFKTIEGTVSQVVKTGADGLIPQAIQQPMRNRVFSYINGQDMNAATAVLTINHGLSAVPSYIRARGYVMRPGAASSFGMSIADGFASIAADGTITYQSMNVKSSSGTNGTDTYTGTVNILRLYDPNDTAQTNYLEFQITKCNEDQVELTITPNGTMSSGQTALFMLDIFI